MTTQSESPEQEAIITLEGDDGSSYSCQILDIFEFEDQEYVLLLNLGNTETKEAKDDQGSIIIMRMTEKDDQSIFQTIESEEEFQRVVAHVEELAKQVED